MSSRSTTATLLIAPHDLEACTDARAVLDLFRKLRYPVEPAPVAVPLESDELPSAVLRESVAARYPIATVAGTRPGEWPATVTLFVLRSVESASARIRGIAQTWTRRFPGHHLQRAGSAQHHHGQHHRMR